LALIGVFASALFWYDRVNGILYYCSERYPLDFFVGPPFVHIGGWFVNTGDHMMVMKSHVTRLWRVMWIGCIVLPAILIGASCIVSRLVMRTTSAHKPQASHWRNSLQRFVVRPARFLGLTVIVVGALALIVCMNTASVHRRIGCRHQPNYSDATITDVPELVLANPGNSLATRVAFSPDGKSVAAGFESPPVIKIWDSTTGEHLLTISGQQASIWDIAFSPGGKYLASSAHDNHPMIFDAHTGAVVRSFKGLEIHGTSIAFSADSERVATGNGNDVQVWDVASGQQILDLPDTRSAQISMKFSPDGRLLAVGGNDWCVRVLDATQGKELLKFRGHNREVWSVAFSPDSKRIVSASRDGSAKVWDATTGQEIVTFTGHCTSVCAVVFSPDGKRVASLGREGVARVWDANTAHEIVAFDIGNNNPFPAFLAVAFSPNGKRPATSTGGSTVEGGGLRIQIHVLLCGVLVIFCVLNNAELGIRDIFHS
jgi:tricorn protease-like protein